MLARDVVRGVAMPTGGFKKGAEVDDDGRIPKGDDCTPKGVLGRGDGVFKT